jgi:hypothetical protein
MARYYVGQKQIISPVLSLVEGDVTVYSAATAMEFTDDEIDRIIAAFDEFNAVQGLIEGRLKKRIKVAV